MKTLIICEKPSLAKTVANALNANIKKDGYYESEMLIVSYAYGHLFELYNIDDYLEKKTKWAEVALPYIPPTFRFKIKDDIGAKKQFRILKDLQSRKDVEKIVNCGDADREGEIIIRIILENLNNHKPVYRLWLPEQTDESIRESYQTMKSDIYYDNLANEGYARIYLDWLYGINLTRFLTIKTNNLYRVGRVLVPIVKYIYAREIEIANFTPTNYYLANQIIKISDNELTITLNTKFDNPTSQEAIKYLNDLNTGKTIVTDVQKKNVLKKRPLLFKLSDLQSELSKTFKMPFDISLSIIQSLYEKGYITYPRTNTQFLSENEKEKINTLIKLLISKYHYNIHFIDNKNIFDSTKIESHSAIIITNKLIDEAALTDNEKVVYKTVLNRFLAVFYIDECIYSATTITLAINDFKYEIKGRELIQNGWSIYDTSKAKDKILPNLNKGDEFSNDFSFIMKTTTAPDKINEQSLSKYLEAPFKKDNQTLNDEYEMILNGIEIGTQATRTQIIKNACTIGYISLFKGIFNISSKGIELITIINKSNINLYADKTVEFSKKLKQVYKNEISIENLIKQFSIELFNVINGNVDLSSFNNESAIKNDEVIYGYCPVCGAKILKNSKAYYCSEYKNGCKFSLFINDNYFKTFNKTITDKIAKDLLKNGKAKVNLKSKSGVAYSTNIIMEEIEPRVKFKKF